MPKGKGSSSQKSEPWGPTQEPLKRVLDTHEGFANAGILGHMAPTHPLTHMGRGMTAMTAMGPNRVSGAADFLGGVMSGGQGMVSTGPMWGNNQRWQGNQWGGNRQWTSDEAPDIGRWGHGMDLTDALEGMKSNALASALPAAAAMFAGSGMTDSSVAGDYIGRAAMEAVAPIEYAHGQRMLDRDFAAHQDFDNRRVGIWDAMMGRDLAADTDFMRRGLSAHEGHQGRGLQAHEGWQGRDLSAYEAHQQRALQAALANQGAQMKAAGMMPGMSAAEYLPGRMLGGVGDAYRADQQAMLDAPMRALTQQRDFLSGVAGLGGTSQGSTRQGLGIGDVLGGAAGLASLFSDRRLKRAIRKIGDALYAFRYMWEPDGMTRVGVMADEAAHALAGRIGPYAVVDYGRMT